MKLVEKEEQDRCSQNDHKDKTEHKRSVSTQVNVN